MLAFSIRLRLCSMLWWARCDTRCGRGGWLWHVHDRTVVIRHVEWVEIFLTEPLHQLKIRVWLLQGLQPWVRLWSEETQRAHNIKNLSESTGLISASSSWHLFNADTSTTASPCWSCVPLWHFNAHVCLSCVSHCCNWRVGKSISNSPCSINSPLSPDFYCGQLVVNFSKL